MIPALLLLAASGCEAEAPARRGPDFPALSGRVVDRADLLSPAQEAELSRQSEAVEREVGPQYVIVTVPSLQGYAIEDYGVQLGRHWGIGSSERDDGLLLIVAPAERKVRIEVGYGLERRVTDPFAAKVIREAILPSFRQGDFPAGIEAASDALVARLRSKATETEIAHEDGLVQ
jgi:uncharacterized protein